MSDFVQELEDLINKHSLENGSDTPDFILADYLVECIGAFNRATVRRSSWYRQNAPIPTVKGEKNA